MARILHLEDDQEIRQVMAMILMEDGHQVTSCGTLKDVKGIKGEFDLYILRQHNTRLTEMVFALDMAENGYKVLLVGWVHKFSLLPFLSVSRVKNRKAVLQKVQEVLGK